jgi:anti-sigma B factor antagonist
MNSSASLRQSGRVTIIDIEGRISLADGLGVMRAAIQDAIAADQKAILLNLDGVDYMDSAGLAELVSAYITLSNLGGKLKLLNVRDRVSNMLKITRLTTLFAAYNDEAQAIASFR